MTDQPAAAQPIEAHHIQAFSTGWLDNQPQIMVLSLTTHKGVHNFAMTEEQAKLIAKTIKDTAVQLAKSAKSK